MNGAPIVGATDGQFVTGLVIGVFLGLLVGPILRSWLAWREWVRASREADLTERFLARWEQVASQSDDRPSDDQRVGPRIPFRRQSAAPTARRSAGPIDGSAPPNGEGSAA
jgi:hypothetical protein